MRTEAQKAANREATRKYYISHREERLAAARQYRDNNLQTVKEKQRVLSQQRRDANPELNRDTQRKYSYGVALGWYDETLKRQNYKCAICGSESPGGRGSFYVDHNHVTGAVRGLLCNACNSLLGYAKDNINTLAKASEYLIKHKEA